MKFKFYKLGQTKDNNCSCLYGTPMVNADGSCGCSNTPIEQQPVKDTVSITTTNNTTQGETATDSIEKFYNENKLLSIAILAAVGYGVFIKK